MTKIMYEFLISFMRARYIVHLILIDFITVIIFGVEYKFDIPYYALFSTLLLLPPSLVRIFSSALCNQTPSKLLRYCEIPSFSPIQNKI
jgi:hypothetical protein